MVLRNLEKQQSNTNLINFFEETRQPMVDLLISLINVMLHSLPHRDKGASTGNKRTNHTALYFDRLGA